MSGGTTLWAAPQEAVRRCGRGVRQLTLNRSTALADWRPLPPPSNRRCARANQTLSSRSLPAWAGAASTPANGRGSDPDHLCVCTRKIDNSYDCC